MSNRHMVDPRKQLFPSQCYHRRSESNASADANADADGRHVGVSDNDVVPVEAQAHATQPTDRIEQRAGSRASRRSRRNIQQLSSSTYSERMTNAMQTTTAQAEMCRMTAHYIRVATRRVDDTLFMQLMMWMGIFRPRPMQLRTQPRRATPIVLDQSLVQSTTTDIQDEKSAEDDDEDELITVRSPQKPSPRYRAEEQSRFDYGKR